MALVVRITSDVTSLTKGFNQAIVAADQFAKSIEAVNAGIGAGAGSFTSLRQDMAALPSLFAKTGGNFAAFAKGSTTAATSLAKAVDKLPARFDLLNKELTKVVNSLGKLGNESQRIEDLARRIDALGVSARNSLKDVAQMGNEIRAAVGAMGAAARGATQTHSALTQMNRSIDESGSLWTRFAAALGGALIGNVLANTMYRLQDAVMRLPGLMIQLAGSLQQTEVALNTMVGAGNKAAGFLADMQEFAAQTPFEFEGLMRSSKMLLAMGINANAVLPIMRRVGDAMAAVGGSSYAVENVTRALAQMAAKGKVNAEELNQLAENGIRILPILAKITNKSTADVLEMAEKGQLLASKYLPQIINAIGDSFTGQMEKQNKTITGSLAALSDAFKMTFAEIGKSLNDLTGFTDKVRSLATALTDVGKAVKQSGLMGIFDAIFGVNAQNAINGFNLALIAIGTTAAASALKFLATAEALSRFRAVMLATTLATLKQTAVFAAIGAAAFTIGANFNWLSERLAPFGKAWDALFYMAGQQIYNFSQVTVGVMKAVRYAITGNFKEAEKSINSAHNALNSVAKDYDGMVRDVSEIGFSFKEGFVNPVTEIQKVWTNLTNLFTEKTDKMTLGTEKLTKELMGLKTEAEKVKTKDLTKQLETAANRAATTSDAFKAYRVALAAIAKEEQALGYFYDENKAKAMALSPVIAALTAQYGARSVVVAALKKEQRGYLEASANISQVEERHAKTLKQILEVGSRLQANLQSIANDLEDQGEAFNAAEKQAKALKQAYRELGNIKIGDKAGFAEFIKNFDASKMPGFGDDMLRGIADALASGDTTAISEALKKAISKASQEAQAFDVAQILKGAETELSVMAMVAKATGKEFNEAAAQAEVFGRTIETLARKGTPAAINAMDDLSKKLNAIKAKPVVNAFDEMGKAMQSVGTAIGSVMNVIDSFGIELPNWLKQGVQAGFALVGAMGSVKMAIDAVTAASVALGIAAPWLWAIGAAIAVVGAGIARLINKNNEATESIKKQQQAWKEAAQQQYEYMDQVNAGIDTLKDATEKAAEAYEKRGEITRMLNDYEMRQVEQMAQRYAEASDRVIDSAWRSADERKAAEKELSESHAALMKMWPAAVQTAMRTGNAAFLSGISELRATLWDRWSQMSADISNQIKSGVISGMKSATVEFINGSKDWMITLRRGIKDAIVNSIIDAFVTKGLLAPMMAQIESLGKQAALSFMSTGKISEQVIKDVKSIIGQTNTVANQIQGTFEGLKGAFDGYQTEPLQVSDSPIDKIQDDIAELDISMKRFGRTVEDMRKKTELYKNLIVELEKAGMQERIPSVMALYERTAAELRAAEEEAKRNKLPLTAVEIDGAPIAGRGFMAPSGMDVNLTFNNYSNGTTLEQDARAAAEVMIQTTVRALAAQGIY